MAMIRAEFQDTGRPEPEKLGAVNLVRSLIGETVGSSDQKYWK